MNLWNVSDALYKPIFLRKLAVNPVMPGIGYWSFIVCAFKARQSPIDLHSEVPFLESCARMMNNCFVNILNVRVVSQFETQF